MRHPVLGAALSLTLAAGAMFVPAAQAEGPRSPETAAGAKAIYGRAAADGSGPLRTGPGERLRRVETTAGGRPGMSLSHTVYERTYKGLPVIGGGVVVVSDAAGRVVHAAGGGPLSRPVATTPQVGAATATSAARRALSGPVQSAKSRLAVLADPAPRLVWHSTVRGDRIGGSAAQPTPSVLHVLVDARTGAVIRSWDEVRAGTGEGFYSGTVSLSTTPTADGFAMEDPTRPGLRCGAVDGSPFTGPDDQWGNGSGTDLETACVDGMYAAQVQSGALSDWMRYDGITGDGRHFALRVGLNGVNAFWTGGYAIFGHSRDNLRQATSLDVVGHEFGHGIFQFAGIDGSGGNREQGGMNESTGDIFGTITEAYADHPEDPPDYLIGEEVGLRESGEPIRVMYDPALLGDPNCYPQLGPETEVHDGAGPQNHWFYLLAEGSAPGNGMPASPICAGGPDRVTGIGIEKAGQIFLEALQTKNPSTWDHRTARAETLAAAVRLFPGSCAEFDTVQAAWDAVGVPSGGGETC